MAAAACAMLVLSACGGTKAPAKANVPARTGAVTTSELTSDLQAMVFPVSAADFTAGTDFENFTANAETEEVDHCLARDAFPAMPAGFPNLAYDNTQFPNVAEIAKLGRFIPTTTPFRMPPSPTKGMSKSERTAYNKAVTRCGRGASTYFAHLDTAAQPLEDEWTNVLDRIDASAPMVRAFKQFDECAMRGGVQATSVLTFIGAASRRAIPLKRDHEFAAADRVIRPFAELFAKCMAGPEAERERLRQRQKVLFLASHAQQVHNLNQVANAVIPNLIKRFGHAGVETA